MDNSQLIRRIEELEKWKAERTRQQVTFPIDVNSVKALASYLFKRFFVLIAGISVEAIGIGNTTIGSYQQGSTGTDKTYTTVWSVGAETVDRQGNTNSSLNTQVFLQDQVDSTAFNSFFYGYRKPLYQTNTGATSSVTSAGNTLTDTNKNWATDELAGAHINIYNSSASLQFTRQIASNTATVITIDGTWPATVSGGTYLVFMPVFLGSAESPWRQVYAGGTDVSSGGDGSVRRAIRIGYGTTAGADVIGIYYGTSTPEGVVTANVGSLFLRTDGGASTTLYVKTSGTSNTGWTAK
jgi:hypothetical protein